MDHQTSLNSLAWRDCFALVDCNNFYASCERLFDPSLRRRPLIVLSNNDGCVVARSPEVKRLGIPGGVPLFKIRDLVDRHGIAVRSSNYELYGDMSRRVMDCLHDAALKTEVYSIDEAFLRLPFPCAEAEAWAAQTAERVQRWTGIAVTVGIGPTKTLAKVASRRAKTLKRPFFCLGFPDRVHAELEALPVEELWGVGFRNHKKLRHVGIGTAAQLADMEECWLERNLGGVAGRRLWWELHGVACHPMKEAPRERQQLACARSFSRPIGEVAELEAAVCLYAVTAAARLRGFGMRARRLLVFLCTSRYRMHQPRQVSLLQQPFAPASDYTPQIVGAARELVRSAHRPGTRYFKAGVVLADLAAAASVPRALFETDEAQNRALMRAVDEVNARMGRYVLVPASFPRSGEWRMSRRRLSPRWTTHWQDLPEVRQILRSPAEVRFAAWNAD